MDVIVLPGCSLLWLMRPLAGLGCMSIKNALSLYSGVFHRPRYVVVLLCFAVAKVGKNSETAKRFREKFCCLLKKL